MKYKLIDYAIISHQTDQIAIAKTDIPIETVLQNGDIEITIKDNIKIGWRFALSDIKKGEFIRQYGYPFAQSSGIRKGELISSNNIENIVPNVELDAYTEPAVTILKEQCKNKKFKGYERKNGQAGTRNYYLVIPASMCASETALQIAYGLDNNSEILQKYSNIDGVVALPHTEGCGCDSGLSINRLITVLAGYISHPNVGGCLIIDLGCEQANKQKLQKTLKNLLLENLKPIDWITIQESGGTRSTIEKAGRLIYNRLSQLNEVSRKDCPISKLIVATECGASDSFSGLTANPIIGNAIDKIVFGGGKAILSEVTEMVGALGMLLSRFRNLRITGKFEQCLEWYADIASKLEITLQENLVPENINGGLINNYLKSLGAVIKGGTTAIEEVIDYAEPIIRNGLNIMQGPGNDLESVTGMVASGANIVCFSTGKGTTTGNAICPVIKIASNDKLFKALLEDMDFNAGELLKDEGNLEHWGNNLLDEIIAVASGKKTWSEKWKQRQFQVWTAGKLSL